MKVSYIIEALELGREAQAAWVRRYETKMPKGNGLSDAMYALSKIDAQLTVLRSMTDPELELIERLTGY